MVKNSLIKETGFVLMTAMVLLMITTSLAIYMLQESLIQYKMSVNFYRYHRLLNLAETALVDAEIRVANRGITTPVLSVADNHATWLQNGQPLMNNEAWVRFAAQKIQTVCYQSRGQTQLIDFFRITVWVVENGANPLLLQSTYACASRLETYTGNCLMRSAPALGRQSWLLLNN